MTYPPPGGYDPNQPGGQPPQQPSDPYSQGYGQGYNSAPPPGPQNYELNQPQQYPSQPPPTNPGMTPPVGVQPGYPQGGPSPLPPQVMPQTGGGSKLPLVLGIVVALVVVLGVVAILVVPGMVGDDDSNEAGEGTTSEPAEEETTEEEEPTEEEPTAEEEPTEDSGGSGDYEGWGAPVNSDSYDVNTPEGVAIEWKVLADDGDTEAMSALMCENPTENLEWELEWAEDYAPDYNFLIWGMSRENNGQTEVWANWTWDDEEPNEASENADVDSVFVVVEEGGTWKICDYYYL